MALKYLGRFCYQVGLAGFVLTGFCVLAEFLWPGFVLPYVFYIWLGVGAWLVALFAAPAFFAYFRAWPLWVGMAFALLFLLFIVTRSAGRTGLLQWGLTTICFFSMIIASFYVHNDPS